MNYLKRIGRLVAICICAVCVGIIPITAHDGPISLSVDNMPAGYLRLGLRNMKQSGGPQFTDSLQWNAKGAKQWDNILKGTKFAFQGRMQATSIPFADNKWGGDLTY